jgi:hypothetical protein
MRALAVWACLQAGAWAQDAPPAAEGPDAAEISQVESVHLSLANSYEVQARELERVIEEHRRMKAEGVDKFYVNDRITPVRSLQELDGLFDKAIRSAQQFHDDLLGLAGWHRVKAGELRGR